MDDSDLSYMHLQKTFASEETVQAKRYFYAYIQKVGTKIKYYHSYNGIFQDYALMNYFKDEIQKISFCGLNYYLQNNKSENRIWDLQEKARNQLHHKKIIFPSAIEIFMCPYALRQANQILH